MSRLLIDLLQNLLLPLVVALSPRVARRRLLQRLSRYHRLFVPEVEAMLQNLPRFLPKADLERAAQQLRLCHLVDKSAPFHLPWAHRRILNNAHIEGLHPSPGQAALILGAHYGCAWWLLPWLVLKGCPVHFVTAPQSPPHNWRSWLLWPLARWRWYCLSKAGGLPLIPMRGASSVVQSALEGGACVNALIDIPPVLAKRCAPLTMLGHQFFMPIQLIRAACASAVPVWLCLGFWDDQLDRTVLHFVRLHGDEQTIFRSYGEHLTAWLEQEPGRWHCWGHVDAFLAPAPVASA